MGFFLLGVGVLVNIVCGFWIIFQAFRVSVGWGLAVMFIPFASLVFVYKNWSDTKTPFLAGLGGSLLVIISAMMAPTASQNLDAAEQRRAATSSQAERNESPASYAAAAAPPAYTPASYYPAPKPSPAPAASAKEEEPKRLAQVYIDRTTKMYYSEDCKNRPEETTRVARSVAVMQGFTPATCPPKKRR